MGEKTKINILKVFSAVTLLIALVVMLHSLTIDSWFTRTLSWMGRIEPFWFLIFGFSTMVALVCNFMLFSKKIGFDKNPLLYVFFTVMIFTGIVGHTINETGRPVILDIIHDTTGILFGGSAIVLLFVLLIIKQRKYKSEFPLITTLAVVTIIGLGSHLYWPWTAMNYNLIMLTAFAILVYVNFIEKVPEGLTSS